MREPLAKQRTAPNGVRGMLRHDGSLPRTIPPQLSCFTGPSRQDLAIPWSPIMWMPCPAYQDPTLLYVVGVPRAWSLARIRVKEPDHYRPSCRSVELRKGMLTDTRTTLRVVDLLWYEWVLPYSEEQSGSAST